MSRPVLLIYCDFDGTVTQDDVTDVLLMELADPSWRVVEEEWERGAIGSHECLARQIPLIRGGWNAIEARLQHMKLDPTFPAFAAWCRTHGLPIRIVSDGMDRIIEVLLARAGIQVDAVYANHLVESATGELSLMFPYPPSQSACRAGLCKCERFADTTQSLRVVIGDGRSDWCWAARADLVFAKSQLLAHCRAQGLPCTAFADFHDIRRALTPVLNGRARRVPAFMRVPGAAANA